jgi:ADP-heptose:LPS heptosyltransferase
MIRSRSKILLSARSPKNAPSRQRLKQRRKATSLVRFLRDEPAAAVCVKRSLGGIGDILMCTPSLKEIKRRFPECYLTFAVDMHRVHDNRYYELVKDLEFIDEVMDARYVDKSKYGFVADISSVCIGYENKGLPPMNRIDSFARHLGLPNLRDPIPTYLVTTKEREEAVRAIQPINKIMDTTLIALHTASNEGKRSWPLDRYEPLIKRLTKLIPNVAFVVFDHNNRLPIWSRYSNVVDASTTNVREMTALIEQVDLFIGPDSGPMHCAGAVGTESIILFGSIPPEARINHYPTHTAITASVPCLGCWYKACPYDTKCMKLIEVNQVASKAKDILLRKVQDG